VAICRLHRGKRILPLNLTRRVDTLVNCVQCAFFSSEQAPAKPSEERENPFQLCMQGSHGLEKLWNSEKKFKGLEKVLNSVISLIKSGKSLENCHLVKKCTTVVIQEP
jgi:recombinational DNA repair protein RecR